MSERFLNGRGCMDGGACPVPPVRGKLLPAWVIVLLLCGGTVFANYTTPTWTPKPTRTPTPTLSPTPTTNTPTQTPTPRKLVFHVPGDFATIQGAIDAAFSGDEIIVSPGTYYENLHTNGKYLNLHGTDTRNWAVIANTIIDGGSRDSVITMAGTEYIDPYQQPTTNFLTIAGFTICNGSAEDGGGINGNGGGLWLDACIIRDNDAAGYGGGVFDVWGLCQYLRIMHNRAGKAGGGLCDASDEVHKALYSCLLHDNAAPFGGGIASILVDAYASPLVIGKCTIAGNHAEVDGGGTYQADSMFNGIVWQNTAGHRGGDMYCDWTVDMFLTILGDAWLPGGWWIDFIFPGPTFDDPRFVDPLNGDYHLRAGSPASGRPRYHGWWNIPPTIDLDFLPSVHPYDAGCFEYRALDGLPVVQATSTPTPPMSGDVRLDGHINHIDLFELALHWQGSEAGAAKADLNASGTVDADDLLLLIEAMLR